MSLAPQVKTVLEPMLSQNRLVCPHPNLYILGTVHIGETSAEEAELLIQTVQPSNVILEIPASRCKRLRENTKKAPTAVTQQQQPQSPALLFKAIGTLPDLASVGFSEGGVSGLLFAVGIVWTSLFKQSWTMMLSSLDKTDRIPRRRNEFEAAVCAADAIQGAKIFSADLEFGDLVQAVSNAMTLQAWINLGLTALSEAIGLKESDPINRGKGESLVEWEKRRLEVDTARASRIYGERSTPELHKALVEDRDEEFAHICYNAMNDSNNAETTVCIVGLVHLDGVVEKLRAKLEACTT